MASPRLLSTARAGVGSVLLEEATVLNPAPLAFFNTSIFSYQQSRVGTGGQSYAVVVADTKRKIKGAMRFGQSDSVGQKRQSISLASGFAVGRASGLGVGVDFIQEKGQEGERKYRQMRMGATHILSSKFSLGVLVEDPFNDSPSADDQVLVGAQYLAGDYLGLIFDVGLHYRSANLNKGATTYRGAVQVQFWSNFFLRGGMAQRGGEVPEKRAGLGVSWVQPKLTFDLAHQDVERAAMDPFREWSFAVSYRF